ncbi:MAG: FAD binding domain-containing protein [Elusimicrobiota bacterium]
MKFSDFRIPERLEDAGAILKELGESAYLVAGGTSLVFQKGKGSRTAVDISRLGLEGIAEDPDGFSIGSGTRIADLAEFRAEGWVLDRVARLFSTQQVRNISTLGGNLARIFRWNDFPVALLALDCAMTVKGDDERVIDGAEYLSSPPHRFFKDGAILTSVRVGRLPGGAGFGYRKEVRTAADFSAATAAAAVELDGNKIKRVRAAVGAALPFPRRLEKVEKLLTGRAVRRKALGEDAFLKEVAEGAAGIEWRGQWGLSDEYAGRLAVVTVRDAIADAAAEASAMGAGEGFNG